MKKYFPVFIIISLLTIFSCKPKENFVYMSNHNFEQEVSQAKYSGLHIQDGDKLQILVSAFDEIAVRPFNMNTMSKTGIASTGETTLTNNANTNSASEYLVNSDGTIVLPVLGAVYCKGMTKQQLKNDLENRLKRYLTDPLVTITLANFNINILGDVKSPGQKTSTTEKVNLFQAIAMAGDMNDSANRTNIRLIRYSEAEGKEKVVFLDLSEASIVNSPYYYLQQNDILYIEADKNKQIAANSTNPNRNLILQLGGVALGIVTLIIGLTRK